MARETTDPRFVLGIEFSSMDEREPDRASEGEDAMRFRLSLVPVAMKRPFASAKKGMPFGGGAAGRARAHAARAGSEMNK